jgi:hypothetical protein
VGKRGPQPKPDHQHGTHGGFVMHQQRGTDPCPWCRRGDNLWKQKHRAKGKCAPGLGWPLLPATEAGR